MTIHVPTVIKKKIKRLKRKLCSSKELGFTFNSSMNICGLFWKFKNDDERHYVWVAPINKNNKDQ
jgi:hypothetical protein